MTLMQACRDWPAATDEAGREAVRARVREALALPDRGDLADFDAAIAAASAETDEAAARKRFERVTIPAPPAAAPVLAELSASDASEPAPVLWRDSTQRNSDALLCQGEVAILASPGGLGKSTLVLELACAAVRVSASAPLGQERYGVACGLRVRAGPVALVSYEDSRGRIAARVSRMQPSGFPSGIHVWPDPGPLFVGDDRGAAAPSASWPGLWDAIRSVKPSMVVVDPASAALDGVSLNDSGPVRAIMRALAVEATAAACGVLVVAHDTKAARNEARAGNDPGAGAVAGSATWFDAARGVLYMTREGDSARELRCIKANYGRSGWHVTLDERTDPRGRFVGFTPAPASASSPATGNPWANPPGATP